MTSFFIWRSCDITGLGAAEAIARNADLLNRGIALLEKPTGLPEDDAPAGVGEPVLDITDATWDDEVDGGSLPPGTYAYNLVPVDTCTGRTGRAMTMPSMSISALGKRRKLRVNFNSKPPDCVNAFVQRDGSALGKPYPLSNQVLDNVPVVSSPSLTGDFDAGQADSFHRTGGADLIVGDAVLYQGRAVRVTTVTPSGGGHDVTIDPPVQLDLPPPPAGFFDGFARTGLYETASLTSPPLFYGMPFPAPFFSFKFIGVPGILAFPQFGDVIVYGSKTGIVIGVETILPPATLLQPVAAVLPLGLLPIPPLPAGLFWLVFRPITAPSVGLYFGADLGNNGGNAPPYDQLTVLGNPLLGGAPVDTQLIQNAMVIFGGHTATISLVENGIDIDGAANLTSARLTISPAFEPKPEVPDALPNGPYLVVPPFLSQFLASASLASSGTYTRLSRVIAITTKNKQWQWDEDGALTGRSGTITDGQGTEARETLDHMMTQAGYGGGLSKLLEKLRGPSVTTVNITYNKTNGTLVRATGGNRLFAVNALGREGNAAIITLDNVRSYRDLVCGSFKSLLAANKLLAESGFAVQRFENKSVQMPAAACPPGQEDSVTSLLECIGLASASQKLKAGEQARVFWNPNGRFQAGARQRLVAQGLTDEEASAALELRAEGRVISVTEFTNTDVADIDDLEDLGPPEQVDEIIDDVRIINICVGRITRKQVGLILRQRGRRGILLRAPGTSPTTTDQAAKFLDDFSILVHELSALLFSYRASFDICDFDAAIASIPDPTVRNNVAAVFAVVEAVLNGIVDVGRAMTTFLTEGEFAAALEAIAGIVASIAADPTLSCLIGPIGLPQIPNLDLSLQGFAFQFQARFQLSYLFGLSVQSVLCAVIGELLRLLPADVAAAASRVIGCLPPIESDFEFPSLDVQIALECALEELQTILDLINELIAEANEIIDFANQFGAGFVLRTLEARNKMCSGDESLAAVFANAANALGFSAAVG